MKPSHFDRGFSFPRFLSALLAAVFCFQAAVPVYALRQPSAVEADPETRSGLEESLRDSGGEEVWEQVRKPLQFLTDETLRSEAEIVFRMGLAGQERAGLLGTIPVSVAQNFRSLPVPAGEREARGRQALVEFLAYRWAYQSLDTQGPHYDTLARMVRSVIQPDQAEGLIQLARQIGIPTDVYPQSLAGRKAGTVFPLYALRSEEDEGIGDLAVLEKFETWMAGHGMQQSYVMPIWDIDDLDPSPYLTRSAFAGNIPYIALRNVPEVLQSPAAQALYQHYMTTVVPALRRAAKVDYPSVMNNKMAILREAYNYFRQEVLPKDEKRRKAFEDFRKREAYWLDDYTSFMTIAIAEKNGWRRWQNEKLRNRDPEEIARWRREHPEEIEFFEYAQFIWDEQWDSTRQAGHRNGVRRMGDMPHYIDGDANWAYQDAADTEGMAGAAADVYSKVGQDFGGSTYDWAGQRRKGYPLHKARIRRYAALFDDVRADYWVGYRTYFRIPFQPDINKWTGGNPNISLLDLHERLKTAWETTFPGQPYPVIAVSTPEAFHQRIRASLMDERLYPAPPGTASFDRERFADAVLSVIQQQGRLIWGPNEPRYQASAFMLLEGDYPALAHTEAMPQGVWKTVVDAMPPGPEADRVRREFQMKTHAHRPHEGKDKGDLEIWIHLIMRMLDRTYPDGPGHDLMQPFQQLVTFEHLGEIVPEDFPEGLDVFDEATRLRRELSFPRIRMVVFGMNDFYPGFWNTAGHPQNSYLFTTTHDGETLLGALLNMAEGDLAAREQLKRVEHVLLAELGLSTLGTPREASPRDQALAIHRALMTKVGRGSADHLLVMYQDWMGLDNTFRSTPPGNALGEKWRDRMPMTVEDLQANQGEPAQQTNQRVQSVMDDPQARRKQAAFQKAEEPRILRMRPTRGGEDGVRHKVIRKTGEKVQVWAEVMPSAYQSEATESDVQTTFWQLENPGSPMNHPMRLYSVLPEGSRLYYTEFPAPAVGEYVLTTEVKHPRSGQWLKATGAYEEPFLIVHPASGLEEAGSGDTATVRFDATEEVFSGSGSAAGSPFIVPNVKPTDTLLIEFQLLKVFQHHFIGFEYGGRLIHIPGSQIQFQPAEPIQPGSRWEARVPKHVEFPSQDSVRIESLDMGFILDRDRGLQVSWGPDTPPFRILRTAAVREKSGLEEMPLQRLATSVLHYRYGRSPLSQGQDLLSPDEQFRRSTLANQIVELLQAPGDQGFFSFVRLIQKMSLLASSNEYRNLTDLLGPNTEWGENIPSRIVTADISRIFSDLLQPVRWGLRQKLYSWLVRVAMLSQESAPRDMQLAVDIQRSAEVGEIVLVGLQSNFSTSTGGMGPYFQELTKGLARMGINVTVIVPVFQADKETVLRNNFARDTGKVVRVPFQNGEAAWEKIYEARSPDGVRVLYLENDRYFRNLSQTSREPEGTGIYGSSESFQLRAGRALSLGALLAIREMKIHPSIIQTNDDHSALLHLYLRQGEPDSSHPLDTRGDDVDIRIRFSDDPSLNKTRTVHVIHALTDGYNLTAHPHSDHQSNDILHNDIGRDPDLRDLRSLKHPKNNRAISPLHSAIVHADAVVTVSRGFHDDSLDVHRRNLFDGFTDVLGWKQKKGSYIGIPNGFNTADLQRGYFSRDVLPQTFLEMGVEEGRRYWAWRLFESVLPQRKAALQESLGLPRDQDYFLYSTLARVEETKGHHLLTAPIWSRGKPAELTYYQGSHHGFEGNSFPFEGHFDYPLALEEQERLVAYSYRTGVETLTALEVALVLMPRLQVVIAGPAERESSPNSQITNDLTAVADRFGMPDGRKRFVFEPRMIRKGVDPLHSLIYTGSTAFGAPSKSESFGLAALEALGGGVPVLQSQRGGLRDMQIQFRSPETGAVTIESGFPTYHPISWLQHLRHFYDVYYENRGLWNEFRYWAIAETDFRGQARSYRQLYRTLWQQSLHGGVILDVHGDLEIELPVLEMASAINQSIAAGRDHSADELKAAGFSTLDANNALVTGIKFSTDREFLDAVTRRYLPTLARVPDRKSKANLRQKLNEALDSSENPAMTERLQAAKRAVERYLGGLEERTVGSDWVGGRYGTTALWEMASGVRRAADLRQPVAVLFDPRLVPGGSAADRQVNLIGLTESLKAAFTWPDDVPLELGLLSERAGLEERGYRIVEVVPHPESLNTVLPQAALPVVVAEALAAAGNRFLVNVGSYVGLEEMTLPEILAALTNRFA